MEDPTTNLTVRALPARTRAKLAARARAHKQSLNSYIVELLSEEAETPTMSEVLAELDDIRRPTGLTTDDAVAAVREIRENEDAAWA